MAKWNPSLPTFKRVKAGFGLPYGSLGINGEIGWTYISATVGVGYANNSDINGALAYGVGMRLYILEPEKKVRVRFGGYYGVNGIYKENGNQFAARGYSLGVGFEHRVTDRIVYDMDIVVPLNNTNSFRPENLELERKAIPSAGIGIIINSR